VNGAPGSPCVHPEKSPLSNPSLNIGADGSSYVIVVVPDVTMSVFVVVAEVVVVWLVLVSVVADSCTVVQP
jgi:hypothetical protein